MDFEEYEQEFLQAIRDATTLIGKSNYANNQSESNGALSEAQKSVVRARQTFKQMKLAANSNASLRVQLRPKLSQYKKTLDGLETDLQRAERSGLFGDEDSSRFSSSTRKHREQMSNNTARMQKQRETLENSNNTLNQTNEVALGVMDELARNRQTIQSARGKAKRMMGTTDRARWLVSDMARRNTKTKLIARLTFTFVCAMIAYLIYVAIGEPGRHGQTGEGGGTVIAVTPSSSPSPSSLRMR